MSDSFAREIFVSSQTERPDMSATARFFSKIFSSQAPLAFR
jgi:hypothetical protein